MAAAKKRAELVVIEVRLDQPRALLQHNRGKACCGQLLGDNPAGGARPDANLDAVNLAARLRDGQQVLVPSTTGATTTTAPGFLPAPTSTVAPR